MADDEGTKVFLTEQPKLKLVIGAASEKNSPAFIVAELNQLLKDDKIKQILTCVRYATGELRIVWSSDDSNESLAMADLCHAAVRKQEFGT